MQLLSNTTANLLKYLRPEKSESIRFLRVFNNFFDVCNSRRKHDDVKLKCALGVREEEQVWNSPHLKSNMAFHK
jgi:hypothetical protein